MQFTDDLLRARSAEAAIVGSPASVPAEDRRLLRRERIQLPGAVLRLGRPDLRAVAPSLELFASRVMPQFARGAAAGGVKMDAPAARA